MINGLENLARRLLVVDDDPALLQMMSWTFSDLGYLVEAAGNCDEAMQLASTQAFEFALVDYHLPDGNGLELVDRLSIQQPGLRTVLMSANPPPQLDCRSCLVKPVPATLLQEMFSPELT